MAVDITALTAVIREYYGDERVEQLMLKNNPLLALLPKNENFAESPARTPMWYANVASASASFAQAQARAAATSEAFTSFSVTRANHYSCEQISGEALEATQGKKGAMIDASKAAIEGGINALKRSLGAAFYRDGTGQMGTITAVNTSSINVSVADSYNFEKGYELVFAAAAASGNLRASGASLVVSNVDRNAGVITFSSNTSGVSGLTAGDICFVKGNRQDASTPVPQMPFGVGAWILDAAPSAGVLFCGTDRSAVGDTTRICGSNFDGTKLSIEEALIEGVNQVATNGGSPDYVFLPYRKYTDLVKSLMGRVQYCNVEYNAQIGFRGVMLECPTGEVKVLPDINCQSNRAWILQLDTWELLTLGKAFRTIDGDGKDILRKDTADTYEIRFTFRGNLRCFAPGHNGVVLL